MAVVPDTLTDRERAAPFLYLQRRAFGGKVTGRNFGVSYGPVRFDLTTLAPMLEAAHERLAAVVIERLPWAAFVDLYDRKGSLFHVDPPYWGCESDYGKGRFAGDQFESRPPIGWRGSEAGFWSASTTCPRSGGCSEAAGSRRCGPPTHWPGTRPAVVVPRSC